MRNSELISHYTSLEGFRGIIESKKIWATNVMFLNDNKEYFHAFEVFDSGFERFKEELKPSTNDDLLFLATIRKIMDKMDELVGYKEDIEEVGHDADAPRDPDDPE